MQKNKMLKPINTVVIYQLLLLIIGLFSLLGCTYGGLTMKELRSADAAKKQKAASLEKDEISEDKKSESKNKPIHSYEVTDKVEIKTSMGNMTIGLYGKDAPNTVLNFLNYVKSGFYNEKIFHRIIPGFMVQTGGFDKDFVKADTNESVNLELIPGIKHEPGTISMARMPSDVNSATSQFFLCVSNTPTLNGGYSAFGKIEKGEDILYAISGSPTHTAETDNGPMDDVPIEPVIIESISLLAIQNSN